MGLSVEDCLAAIASHTRGLAAAAEGNLDLRIEHCPDWSMADLVWHLASVHWFWENVARLRPSEAPEDLARPDRPADEELISTLLANMATLVDTLRAADQTASCWTWGLEENVGFITRHQVQEAAVHHWDAVNAAGRGQWEMNPVMAMDAIEEFLTHSVANRRWPVPQADALGGTLWFCPCFADTESCPTWLITDGAVPGTLRLDVYPGRGPDIEGEQDGDHVHPAALLLWLYGRLDDTRLDSMRRKPGQPRPLLERFRAFTNTD